MTFDETLWMSLPTPALLVDPNDVIERVNPASEGFFNLSYKQMVGQNFWECIAIDAPLEDAFSRARADDTVLYVNDVDVGSGEGPPCLSTLQIAPLSDNPGYMIVMISARDLITRLGRSKSPQSAAKSAIGMAEMLAHEIKNPLAGITGAAQLLSMNLPKQDQEMTDLIVEESRRIVKLLEQVEQFGNVQPPDRKPVNIHDVLDRARRSAMLGFGAHMRFIETYDPSLPLTYGDADQLLQVILNLLKNASQAADIKGGTIELKTYYDLSMRLRRTDGLGGASVPLKIEIIDNGPGLPADIATNIFEPFVSGRENGTGLGLALVSKIIGDHDGWIAVDSVPGKTVFRISLPVAPKEAQSQISTPPKELN
ncbi:two-component system sensor histidine kinase NtrB [Algirhabdus cladophorae]|uniref:two-component system sensor histidine kinase NtrB n=1 Tax=Algirhabdus cladophorae TaxID=3377108 RepID=UPI003B846253